MRKILIIEDNKDLQNIYRHSFEKGGYEVITKDGGEEGILFVAETMPDVILLDLMMPVMNGFEFLKKLQELYTVKIPVIVCSNISDTDVMTRVLAEGATAVILKVDYVGKQLVDKVTSLVDDYYQKVQIEGKDEVLV